MKIGPDFGLRHIQVLVDDILHWKKYCEAHSRMELSHTHELVNRPVKQTMHENEP